MIKFYDTPEDFKNNNISCNAWVAAAIGVSAAVGAGASIYGANKAADAQSAAADKAAGISRGMFDETSAYLKPFRAGGEDALGKLQANNYYTDPINLTQDWLENTPGYQFTKTQGLKAVGNSAAARGLGVSGAALKGAANFATGLADNTYKTQFDVARANKQDAYANLKALVDTGASAAAGAASLGEKSAYAQGQYAVGAGNAQAAAANATGGAIGNFANNVGGYAAYKGLYGNNSTANNNWAENNPGVNGSAYYGPAR